AQRGVPAGGGLVGAAPAAPSTIYTVSSDIADAGFWREAYEASGGKGEGLLAVGRALLRRRKSAEVLELTRTHLSANPADGQSHLLLFELYRERGDARQAEWHYRKLPADRARTVYGAEGWFAVLSGRAWQSGCAHATSLCY